jgi:hypothetical protein
MSKTAVSLLISLPLLAAPSRVDACSMCHCGDPTFTLVGSQIFVPNQWWISLDGGRYEKTTGVTGEPGVSESETEDRYTFSLTRSFGRGVTLVAQLPIADKTVVSDEGTQSLTGLSNPELLANFRVGAAEGRPGNWLSLGAGVRLPWGESAGQIGGQRADEHVQPSTGAWGGLVSLSFSRLVGDEASFFGSVLGRVNGRNDFGYQYGNGVFANVAYERRLLKWLNGVVELNYRWAAHDEDQPAVQDPDTGGTVLYVTPRVIAKIQKGLYFRVAVQVPIIESLYGVQNEKTNVLIGFTSRF